MAIFKRYLRASILAGCLVLLGFLPNAFAAESPLLKELIQKAKKEGKVTIWTPMDNQPMRDVLKRFERRFGIKAEHRLWRNIDEQQRTLIELKAGRNLPADVLTPAQEGQQQFEEAGVFRKPPYNYLHLWQEIDERQIDPAGSGLNIAGNARAVAYNPTLVPENLVPKTWEDCARPELKGKVVLDIRNKLYALQWHRREWFRGWVKRMVANDVKLVRGQTEVAQLLSAGAYPVFCSAQTYSFLRLIEKGAANIKLVVPGELLVEASYDSFILNSSQRPHAAQLLIGWLASEEGQALLDKEDYRGYPWVRGTMNAKLAEGKKVLFCDPRCTDAGGEMTEEYIELLGLPTAKKKR